MKLIATTTLGAAAANIEFTSIPQDGTDLVLVCALRSSNNDASGATRLIVRPNGSSLDGSNRHLEGNGSTASSGTRSSIEGRMNSTTETADTFSNASFYFTNYTSSSAKSISSDSVYENNGSFVKQALGANLWDNSAAITSITILSQSGNLVSNSTISLYKVTKGTDGIVTTS
jgi:hypothetical protein